MVEEKKGTLSLNRSSNLHKPQEPAGRVRQSFSHGKSKVVTVEVKRRSRAPSPAQNNSPKTSVGEKYAAGRLTDQEIETRIKAVQFAIKENKEQEQRRQIEEEQQRRIKRQRDARKNSLRV